MLCVLRGCIIKFYLACGSVMEKGGKGIFGL